MELKLYEWNGNDMELKRPTLQELLEFGQPFVITLSPEQCQEYNLFPKSKIKIPAEIVLGNLRCPWFSTWPGLRIMDYKNNQTYLLSEFDFEEGKRIFKRMEGLVYEWSYDKYIARTNKYGFKGNYPNEIFDEFRKLGFGFPVD